MTPALLLAAIAALLLWIADAALGRPDRLDAHATPGECLAARLRPAAIRPKTGDMRQRARVAMCGYRTWEEDRANAEFFAAARTLLPQMADQLEALRAEVRNLRPQVEHWHTYLRWRGEQDAAAEMVDTHEAGQ